MRAPTDAPSRTDPARFASLAACLALAAGLLAVFALSWGGLEGFVDDIDTLGACRVRGHAVPFCDFRKHFLPMAKAIRVAIGPAEGYLYSPVLAVLVRLPASLGDQNALRAWVAFLIASTLLLYVLPLRALVSPPGSRLGLAVGLAYTLLFFGCVPVLHNFAWGQVSVPIVLLSLAGGALYGRGRRGTAAFLFALATAIKFYPGLFVLYPALRRDARTLGAFAIWLVVWLFAVPAAVMGPARMLGFYGVLAQHIPSNAVFVSRTPYPQYAATAVSYFVTGASDPGSALFRMLQLLGAGAAAMNVVLLARVLRRRPENEFLWTGALLFTATPFVTSWSWAHYFVYLPLVQAFAVRLVARSPLRTRMRALAAGATLASCVLSGLPFFVRFASSDDYYRRGYLFLADALLLVPLWIGALATPPSRPRDAAPVG